MSGEPWLILPTYNEAENLDAIVAVAGEVLAAAAPEGFRVLVVDDGSPDGTGRLADELAASKAWLEVLHRTEKNGIGPASATPSTAARAT
jgi:dolichol-phosphate mannosyltransferase